MSHSPPSHANPAAYWILVVDDEAPIRDLVRVTLGDCDVREANSANEARALLTHATTPPRVTLLDVFMPGEDGLTFARQLRRLAPQTAIILFSSHLTDEAYWPDDLKSVRFLPKPFSLDELRSAVQEAMSETPPGGS